MKWYDSPAVDEGIVISARVRFARNFEKYPFPLRLSDAAAREMAAETARAALSCNDGNPSNAFRYFDISETPAEDNKQVTILVTGNGFLYNMIRIIAGTLIDIGAGKYPPEKISEIIAAKDRRAAGPTAPAGGLTLIGYENFYS